MAKALPLPDGSNVVIREGETPQQAWERAQVMYPEAFGGRKAPEQAKPDTTGFKAAAAAGFERLKGETALTAGKLGIMSAEEAQAYQKERERAAQERFTPTQEGWTEAPWQKFKETLGGSVPYMVAPAAAGLAALAAPVAAPTAAALGAAGAFTVGAGQFTGTNLARQMDTGKSLEETSLGAAVGAAIPQAALDTAAMALMPGIGKLFGSVGTKLTAEQAKAIASQTLGRTLADYAAKTGTAMGREGFTETVQQVLERAQAGLSITDPEARKEYIDSFIGGAALAGAGAPIGRAFERGAAKEQAAKATREERAAAQQAEAAAAEEARAAQEAEKSTPEYALQLGQQYDALLADFQAKRAALTKPGKDATPVEKAEYADAQKEVKALNDQLRELTPEYRRTKALREQALAAQEKAAMSPMDYMLAQTEEVPESQFTPREPDMAGYEMPEPVVPPRLSPMEYAQERLRLAQEQQIEPDAPTFAQYLMADPAMARQVLEDSDVQLPKGVRKELGKAVTTQESLDRLQRQEKAKEATGAAAQRLQLLEEEEAQASAQQAPEAEQLAPGVGSEIMALRRIAANPAVPVKDEAVLSTKIDRLVDVLLQGGPAAPGRVVAGAGAAPTAKADALRAQLAYANATDNRLRANELKKQLADLNEPDTEIAAGDMELGAASKEAGVEGRLSKEAMQANRITRLSGTQLNAYDRLVDFVQRVREGNQEVSDARKQTLRNAAERLKETAIGLALNEADARRVQAGRPELSTDEKVALVRKLNQTMDELIERGTSMFQKPVEQKAQMRGTQIVMGAGEDQQQPAGRRVFDNYRAATSALRGQMREAIDTIGGFEPPATPRPERKVQRVEPPLRQQFQAGSERSVAEQFTAAYDRAKSDEDYRVLKDIEAKFGKLSEAAQEEALAQVRRVENNMPLEVGGTLKDELADLRSAGVSETGQAELFPGESEKATTRTTTSRFMRLLDSNKVQELKAALVEEQKVAEFQAKRAATLAANLKKKLDAAAAFAAKVSAKTPKTPVGVANAKLKAELTRSLPAVQAAERIREERSRVLKAIKDDLADLKALRDDTVKKRDALSEEYFIATQRFAVWPKDERTKEATIRVDTKLKQAIDTLQTVEKAYEETRTAYENELARQLDDTVENSLLRKGDAAQKRIDAAKDALRTAEVEEARARTALAAEKAKPPVESKLRGITRVYRDTSSPAVQTKVNALRKTIAAAEAAHEKAQLAGDAAAMEKALKSIESAYDKVYEVLNNAPVRQEAVLSDAQVKEQEAFDRAQAKVFEESIRLFEEKAGIKPLKMAERRTIASVRNVKSGRIETQFKEESVAAQEARVKREEQTGKYPARALEQLAKARAERAEVQQQLDYIAANPAEAKTPAKARQEAARKQALAKRKELDARIKALSGAQREVVAEAKLEQKATKELRKERQRMLRSPGRLQEAIDMDEALYRVTNKSGESMQADAVTRLAERMTKDWANVPEIVVVADESGLPIRIRNQAERDNVTGRLPGLYDTKTGKVYLVASNLFDGSDVIATVAHEVAGHFGLQTMLGAGYAPMMQSIYANNANVRKQAQAKMAANKNLSQNVAVEEVLADMAEGDLSPVERTILQRVMDGIRNFFRKLMGRDLVMTDDQVRQIVANARTFVIEGGVAGEGKAQTEEAAYRTAKTAPNALTELAGKIGSEPQTFKQRWGKLTALEAEMQGVDMRAGLRDALKAGAEGLGDPKMFAQAMYNVLKADQKMPLVYTVMSNGPLELYKDDKGLHGVRSSNKNSAVDVFSAINELPAGDSKQKMALAQAYLVAQRAMNKGLEKLDLGALGVKEADLQAALDAAKADHKLGAALEKVRRVYNAYNKGMIDFLAATGAIPKAVAEKLNAAGDYVPFYRVDSTGKADLVFTEDAMVTIGDIRRQPYLAELKGGETRLLPLDEAIPRNTILLTDKALTNMATKDVAYGLQAIGKPAQKMIINKGSGPADPGVIRFNQEPDPADPKDTGERWLKVDTAGTMAEGVPTELLVKSLEGAHLPLPGFLKVAGAATDILRAGVTRTPLYIARQLLREPMAAAFTGGVNYNTFTAVLKAGKEFVKMTRGQSETEAKLLEKGLIQSGIFTGDVDDMGKFALQLVKGDQNAMEKLFALTDKAAIKADASTRALVYESALANGLSEVEADMATMESMNFYKRGLSPTIQYASRLIPFFNAQIQGLNVLYKAATGKMPFEERQRIQRKFFNNAMLLTAAGIVYAMAMEDDETWRNARPRDKMTNFFLPIFGTDEMLKLPIPFEAGYFYSLAVAAVEGMREQTDNKAQWQAIRDLFLNSIPGVSSMGVPQIIKPVAEIWSNKNFLSGAPIESLRLQGMAPEERYNATTTEFAKMLSRVVPILSPIQIEHLVRGYLGVLPLAAVAAANDLFAREGAGQKPEKRLSEMALVGSAFQKKYGGADADVVFEAAKDTMEARTTLNKLLAEGRREDAMEYRAANRVELALAPAAGQYRQLVGRINADLRRTQERTDLTAVEKRQRIDRLEEAKQQAAARFLEARRRAESAVGG